ncbi:hypothetical protein [Lampropedia aestuarii]|uniref:hypothetical protein n=1 Tax=Lampropedia aestuarii TaxID=2562762 RepID=UPI0024686537|nr:hypothetical protein [Lampropedia aestuarii]MDH5856729.1 hypothetical protein [Lampropedia aestuarii]
MVSKIQTKEKNHKMKKVIFLRPFLVIYFSLLLIYLLWMLAVWPGILGPDSLAILLEVDTNREFQSGKPPFWFLHTYVFYNYAKLVEVPILVQIFLCVFVLSRILAWMYSNGLKKYFIFSLFFVACGPGLVYYVSSLYSDGIYAVCLSGLLFEIWRCCRNRRIDFISGLMIFLCVPYAVFSRPNGILNLVIIFALFFILKGLERRKAVFLVGPWIFVGIAVNVMLPVRNSIGTIFPMVLYETVGFLEKRPMGLWERNEPRVTDKTVQALTSSGKTLEHISDYYDHYYWDPLIFFSDGPNLLSLPGESKKIIVKEFFKYNLWHNFPAFAASKINIFFYSGLAMGGIAGPTNADNILPQTESVSRIRPFEFFTNSYIIKYFSFSERYHGLIWAPWIGCLTIIFAFVLGIRRQAKLEILVVGVYVIQFFAVFVFSIAGEYRYLLSFFTAPLVTLPIIAYLRGQVRRQPL